MEFKKKSEQALIYQIEEELELACVEKVDPQLWERYTILYQEIPGKFEQEFPRWLEEEISRRMSLYPGEGNRAYWKQKLNRGGERNFISADVREWMRSNIAKMRGQGKLPSEDVLTKEAKRIAKLRTESERKQAIQEYIEKL